MVNRTEMNTFHMAGVTNICFHVLVVVSFHSGLQLLGLWHCAVLQVEVTCLIRTCCFSLGWKWFMWCSWQLHHNSTLVLH